MKKNISAASGSGTIYSPPIRGIFVISQGYNPLNLINTRDALHICLTRFLLVASMIANHWLIIALGLLPQTDTPEPRTKLHGRLRQRNELMEEIRSLGNRLLAVKAVAYYKEILAPETEKLERFRTLEAESYTRLSRKKCLHFGRREFFLVTGFKVGSVSFRKYRNGDIPFRNRLFPEKIRYDVKVIDVLALIEDEEKFSKVNDEDAMQLCLLLSLEVISWVGTLAAKQKDNEKFHPVLRGREKGRDAALIDRVRDLDGICERLLTLPKEIKSLKVRIFKLETIIQFSLYPTVITLKREGVQKEENLKKFFQKEELLQDISDDEPDNKDDTSSEKMANRITAKSLVELDTGVMNLTELAAFYGGIILN
ncbi:hypothetical protein Tco_1150237 [Tanacetum coccineum]